MELKRTVKGCRRHATS